MKEKKYTQCILCEGATFQESVDKFNRVMRENSAFFPTYERVGESFLVFIKVTEHVPETVVEAKWLEGCRHYCSECEHCHRDLNRFGEIDKRKKTGTCHANGVIKKIRIDSIVCDTFYEEGQGQREEVVNG